MPQEEQPSVYLETTVVSYLTARGSRDLLLAAHQQVTREWFREQREYYALSVSDLVYMEAEKGDLDAVRRRLEVLDTCAVLAETEEVRELAGVYARSLPLPPRAALDALHMALATWHRMEYLLTWNCRHIANASNRRRFEGVNSRLGLPSPTICTPEELLYGSEYLD
jgi:hypothetical protein